MTNGYSGESSKLPVPNLEQTMSVWKSPVTTYPWQGGVHKLLEAQVDQTPEAVAVVFGSAALTYQQLNERANQLANYLARQGVGPDVRVGLCVDRSLDLVVGLLGILKAGGAYVPLDPSHPQERLNHILHDAKAAVLLTHSARVAGFTAASVRVVCIDSDWTTIARESVANFASRTAPGNLAYVIYTSGSSGQPKGVAMPHQPLCNMLIWQLRQSQAAIGTQTLQFASCGFDVSFQEIFATWCSGGTLVLMPEEIRHDAGLLLDVLREQAVERVFLPYVMLQQLARTADQQARWPSYVREFIIADEPLQITPEIVALCSNRPGCVLVNQYGTTETHVVTSLALSGTPQEWPLFPPIGRAVMNTHLYVLDESLTPVPVAVPGHLYIGGEPLARGYLDQPALTAERFIPNPFNEEVGTRMYKTGDVVRYLSDGTLLFLGRDDHQIKIRGFRVEPGEVEVILRQHPGVREAIVVVHEHPSGQKRLVGYVVAERNQSPTTHELRKFLSEQLPEDMVPSAISMVPAIPVTVNGKVDRRALSALEIARPALAEAFVPPRNRVEELLVIIWTEALGVASVGVEDHFFDLGGHSLIAMQMISRIKDVFQIELSPRRLFELSTIAALATYISSAQYVDRVVVIPPLAQVSSDKPIPLTSGQQGIWLLEQLVPASPVYHIPVTLHFSGMLDVAALSRTLSEIVRRHAVLRTAFVTTADETPVQTIIESLTLDLLVVDLQSLPVAMRPAERDRLVKIEAMRSFDLGSPPLLRATLLQMADDDYVLLLVIHHIVVDDWSMRVLISEIFLLYAAFSNGQSQPQDAPLPDLPIQYADYAIWEQQIQEEVAQSNLAYWRHQLMDVPRMISLPTDRPRPAVRAFQGARFFFEIPAALRDEVAALSRRTASTFFMTLFAMFNVLLYRYTNYPDLVVGTTVANRRYTQLEQLIGFFATTLVLRTDLSGNPAFSEVLQRVREVTLEAYAHQDMPFEKLVDSLDIQHSLTSSPLVQVLFTFHHTLMVLPEIPGLVLKDLAIDHLDLGMAKFDLSWSIEDTGSGLQGMIEYSTALFEAATISRMADHFRVLLEAIVANPDERIAYLPLLTEAERDQMLVEWNRSTTLYPRDAAVHQLIEEQAARSPDVPAIVFEGQQLTYAELNGQANQLAHYLRGQGVGPDSVVALCVERSLEMIVGMLAILKAGGAYLPLDPAYPADRVQYMLSHSQAPMILTQAALVSRLPEHAVTIFRLDADWPTLADQPTTNPPRMVLPDHLAYIIFTSGSTGRPKGVMVKQQGLINLAYGLQSYFDDHRVRMTGLITSISFDISVNQIFPTLFFGRTLHIIPDPVKYDSRALLRYLDQQQIHLLDAVPSYLETVLSEVAPEQPPNALRYLLIGGEKIEQRLLQAIFGQLGSQVEVVNIYGLTELSDINILGGMSAADLGAPITVGKPLQNNRIYILDQCDQLVPLGSIGEVCVAGESVSRGYLFRPELTAERFVPCPFEDGQIMVRTGDLGRWRDDGTVEILGRIDQQVKLRGFRIELDEIEAVLRQHPAVRRAVVVTQELEQRPAQLIAYIVPKEQQRLDEVGQDESSSSTIESTAPGSIGFQAPGASELRAFLRQQLPDYMVPTAFVSLAALPTTPNGKVDRKALPVPESLHVDVDRPRIGPRNPVEQAVTAIWSEVLGIEQIDVYDNFFALGGHSLMVTQVISRVRATFQRQLPLHSLFDAPTVADFAELIIQYEFEQADDAELAELLTAFEGLSDAELQALLDDTE